MSRNKRYHPCTELQYDPVRYCKVFESNDPESELTNYLMTNPHDVVISSSMCYDEDYNTCRILVIFERLDSEWSSKNTSVISLITETMRECARDIINSAKHSYSSKTNRSVKVIHESDSYDGVKLIDPSYDAKG